MVYPGGWYNGGKAEQLKKICLAFNKQKGRDKTMSKITFILALAGGNTFMSEGNSAIIAVYLAAQTEKPATTQKAEFTDLDSDMLLTTGFLADGEGLEFNLRVVIEEEPETKIEMMPTESRPHQ